MSTTTKSATDFRCPDCGDVMLPGSLKCMCGWRDAKSPRRKHKTGCSHDGRCQFKIGNVRCPLVGNTCGSPHSAGPWHCAYHDRNPNHDSEAARILNDIVDNAKKYERPRERWRDSLCDATLQKLGLVRRDGETASEFVGRCTMSLPADVRRQLGYYTDTTE